MCRAATTRGPAAADAPPPHIADVDPACPPTPVSAPQAHLVPDDLQLNAARSQQLRGLGCRHVMGGGERGRRGRRLRPPQVLHPGATDRARSSCPCPTPPNPPILSPGTPHPAQAAPARPGTPQRRAPRSAPAPHPPPTSSSWPKPNIRVRRGDQPAASREDAASSSVTTVTFGGDGGVSREGSRAACRLAASPVATACRRGPRLAAPRLQPPACPRRVPQASAIPRMPSRRPGRVGHVRLVGRSPVRRGRVAAPHLDVHAAATPQEAVSHGAREGRVRPVLRRRGAVRAGVCGVCAAPTRREPPPQQGHAPLAGLLPPTNPRPPCPMWPAPPRCRA